MSSSSGFNADNVPLEDLQAQERELAYIQAMRKQARSHSSKTTRPRAKVEPRQQQQQQKQQHYFGEVIEIDGDHSDTGSEAEVEMQSVHYESHEQKERPRPQRAEVKATKTTKVIAHPTSFRALYVDVAPANLLNVGGESVDSLGFILAGDRPLTCYGKWMNWELDGWC
jgi:hypothetical protein